MSELFKKIKEYLIIVLSVFITALLVVLQSLKVDSIWILIIAISYLILFLVKEIKEKKKSELEVIERKMTDESIKRIENEVVKRNLELYDKQKILMEFLNRGIIKEDDLILNLNQETFITVYHYNRSVGELRNYLPNKKTPIIQILNDLGFLPVGYAHGSYFYHVININSLPEELREVKYLEAYIRKKFINFWNSFMLQLEKGNKFLYEKYKNKRVFNLSYFISKVFPINMSVGYVNFSSFDRRFLTKFSKFVNIRKMHIDKQKLNDLLNMASISIFVDSFITQDREKIIRNEDKIKKELKIKNLLDYENIKEQEWILTFTKLFDQQKAIDYAEKITSSIQRCCPIIREFISGY